MALNDCLCVLRIIPYMLLGYFRYLPIVILILIAICFELYTALRQCCNGDMQGEFSDDETLRGNKYVDKLLKDMLDDHGDDYDPYKIDDRVIGFHKKVLFVNVSGEAKLFDGYITGMKTLHRTGDCSLKRIGDRLHIVADLGAGILDFFYSGTVRFMNMGPTITVRGILAYAELYMEFSADASTGNDGTLEEFHADDMRGMNVKITGLGPLNWAMNTVASATITIFKGYIRGFVEGQVKKYLSQRIREYPFPAHANSTPPQDVI